MLQIDAAVLQLRFVTHLLPTRLFEGGLIGARIDQREQLPGPHDVAFPERHLRDRARNARRHRDGLDGRHRTQFVKLKGKIAAYGARYGHGNGGSLRPARSNCANDCGEQPARRDRRAYHERYADEGAPAALHCAVGGGVRGGVAGGVGGLDLASRGGCVHRSSGS